MSYRFKQYTKCVQPQDHRGLAWYLGGGGLVGVVAAVALVLAGGALVPAVGVAALLSIIGYCRWWLFDRLICVGGVECAVGWLHSVEPPEGKSGLDRFDTDFSLNLILAPNLEGMTQAEAEAEPLQGRLVARQPALSKFHFEGLKDVPGALHCEFEGGGVWDLYQACRAALPFATAASAVCAIPIFGAIACLIAAAVLGGIATVIVVAGIVNALGDRGSPTDVNAQLTELHPLHPTPDSTDRNPGCDVLVIRGLWVYDTAHEGWNELHPIMYCQTAGYIPDAPSNWQIWHDSAGAYLKRTWCDAVAAADSPQTRAQQQQPQNDWQIHPDIDGCAPGTSDGEPGRHGPANVR